jgi:hypothetical protein
VSIDRRAGTINVASRLQTMMGPGGPRPQRMRRFAALVAAPLLLTGPPPRLESQGLTWSASSTYVQNEVQVTLAYRLTNDCADRRAWAGTQEFTMVGPFGVATRRSHAVRFALPAGADRFEWYDDAAGIRWFAELRADSLILYNARRGDVNWRLAAPIEGLPGAGTAGRPLDLTLHLDWPTFNQRVQEVLTRLVPEEHRDCPTLNALIREHAGDFIDRLGLSRSIRDAIRGPFQDLMEGLPDRVVEAACGASTLDQAEREALENLVRAVRQVPWGCGGEA